MSHMDRNRDWVQEELQLLQTTLPTKQKIWFDSYTHMFHTTYHHFHLSLSIPPDYPHHTDTIKLTIDPHFERAFNKCNDVIGDILPGECMLFEVCQAFRSVLDGPYMQIPVSTSLVPLRQRAPSLSSNNFGSIKAQSNTFSTFPEEKHTNREAKKNTSMISSRCESTKSSDCLVPYFTFPEVGISQNPSLTLPPSWRKDLLETGEDKKKLSPAPQTSARSRSAIRESHDFLFRGLSVTHAVNKIKKEFYSNLSQILVGFRLKNDELKCSPFHDFFRFPNETDLERVEFFLYGKDKMIWTKWEEKRKVSDTSPEAKTKGDKKDDDLDKEPQIGRTTFKSLVGSYPLLEEVEVISRSIQTPFLGTSFSILTWNVFSALFDEKQKGREAIRIPLQLEFLKNTEADLIALQEVTPKFWTILSHDPFFLSGYNMTHLPAHASMGQVICCKHKIIQANVLRLSLHKHALFIVFELNKSRVVKVVNIQLISDFARESSARRLQELSSISHYFGNESNIILLGDFNFGDHDTEEKTVPWGSFLDTWKCLHGNEDGFTFDYEGNSMALVSCGPRKESRRLDRIMVRGGLIPQEVRICKNQTCPDQLTLSSHYALQATFHLEVPFIPFASPVHLDEHNAVVLIPPVLHWEVLNTPRRKHDFRFPRWMPHIPLCHPFIKLEGQHKEVMSALTSIASRVMPFRIRLQNFITKAKYGRFFLSLVPEVMSPFENSLNRLLTMFSSVYTMCSQELESSGLVIGEFTRETLYRSRAELVAHWEPLVFDVTHIHLITRTSRKEQMKILHSVPLGINFGASPEPSSSLTFSMKQDPVDFPGLLEEPEEPPPMVLEAHWGTQIYFPENYWPKDSLERWMLSKSVTENARAEATHISQLGAMYHLPQSELSPYLQHWEKAIREAERIPFFIEEIRPDRFRLYVDVDFKTLKHQKVDLRVSEFVNVLLSHTLSCFPQANVTVCVTEYHGRCEERTLDTVGYKSGYHFYFQHIWVETAVLNSFLETLAEVCGELVPSLPGLPQNIRWKEVVNTYSVLRDRLRLLSSSKRKKNRWRRYTLRTFLKSEPYNANQVLDIFNRKTLRKAYCDQRYVDEVTMNMGKLLFATTLSPWEGAADREKFSIDDNTYNTSKFYGTSEVNKEYINLLLRRRIQRKPQGRRTGRNID